MALPHSFIHTYAGTPDFGHLADLHVGALKAAPGPIRLCRGFGGNGGFGLVHIEEHQNRMLQLANLGFDGVVTYCHYVAQNFDSIHEGHSGRLIVARKHIDRALVYLTLVVDQRRSDDGPYWSIVTGLPKRVVRETVVWRKDERKGGSEPAPNAASRSRFATLTLPGTKS